MPNGAGADILRVAVVSNFEDFNCDTLTKWIDGIPTRSIQDANIHEIISILIGEPEETRGDRQGANLQCAGSLAKMPGYRDNRDAGLAYVIKASIGANLCGAAREPTNHVVYPDNKSAQKAKVARECLGRA